MKKTFLIVVLVLVALGVMSSGVAYAQGIGTHGPMVADGEGPLHEYLVQAYADALGLTPESLEARLANGETVYQVALSHGVPADQIPTLLADARVKALDAAAAHGVVTTDQAAWMKSRGFGQGGYGVGIGPCNGTGQPIGGGMQRGGRWGSGQ